MRLSASLRRFVSVTRIRCIPASSSLIALASGGDILPFGGGSAASIIGITWTLNIRSPVAIARIARKAVGEMDRVVFISELRKCLLVAFVTRFKVESLFKAGLL